MGKKFKAVAVSVKAGPEDGLGEGEFLVYPSTFTKKPDSYGDIVAPGAFAETIQAWKDSGQTLPGLFGHRMDDPDFYVAKALDMGEDDHGWWVKGAFDMDSPKGPQVYRLVKNRMLNQLSFAYDVLDEGQVELEDGKKANELRKLDIYEFSFVPVGANSDTSIVAVKYAREIAAKAGRVISAKNETSLRTALESLETSAAQIKDVLTQMGEEVQDQEKSTDPLGAKNDEPVTAKFDERPVKSPIQALAQIKLTNAL